MISDAEKANMNLCAYTHTHTHTHTLFRGSQLSEMEDIVKRSEFNLHFIIGKNQVPERPGTCAVGAVRWGRAG